MPDGLCDAKMANMLPLSWVFAERSGGSQVLVDQLGGCPLTAVRVPIVTSMQFMRHVGTRRGSAEPVLSKDVKLIELA
jgi:hypothetical protein